MKWIFAILMTGLSLLVSVERAAPAAGLDARSTDAAAGAARSTDAAGAARSTGRFGYIDVYIDSGKQPLAVYQFELKSTRGDAKLVGVERGDSAVFHDPPYYDPAAINQQRVIVGSYSLSGQLPAGKTRVARLQMYIAGEEEPAYDLKVTVAAAKDGSAIPASASLVEGAAR